MIMAEWHFGMIIYIGTYDYQLSTCQSETLLDTYIKLLVQMVHIKTR